jgi:glycosyltransferase involved in cell wall biosynthesis
MVLWTLVIRRQKSAPRDGAARPFPLEGHAMNRPLNIALVITELDVGGAERCLTSIATGLDRNRFAPVVYCLGPHPIPPHDLLARRLQEAGVPVHFFGCTAKSHVLRAVRELRRRWAERRPDLVQAMLFHANVVAGWALGSRSPVPFCLGVRVADPSRWRLWIESRVARRADRVVCVSRAVADYVSAHLRQPAERLVTIPNGVDVAALERRKPLDLTRMGLPPGRRAITCVSRLVPQKGVDLLLHSMGELFTACPDYDLLLVGDGPDLTRLKDLAARCQIANRVHFAGWQAAIPEILLASDLMILPSRWEGMPNVLLEAMACGRPVMCSAAEGVAEVLGPLADDQTAPVGNAQQLVRKAIAILQNGEFARQLGLRNRLRVVAEFSLERMVRHYEDLFQTLVQARQQVW